MANYKQQTAGVLGGFNVCPTCPTALSLCFATSEITLCCGAATVVTVYIDSAFTFTTTPNFFTDATLTTIAPIGFYSNTVSC